VSLPRATIALAGVPAGEGHAVLLVGDGAEASRLRATGALALPPELVEALGAVARAFPGSRVVELRKAGAKR
jgi:hypothetical protein